MAVAFEDFCAEAPINPIHIHLLLNHVPILGPPLALLLLGYARARGDAVHSRLALGLLVFVALVAIPVYLSGEPAEHRLKETRQLTESAVEAHEEAAAAGKTPNNTTLAAAFLGGLLVSGWTAWTAYLGGTITHTEMRSSVPADVRSASGDNQ